MALQLSYAESSASGPRPENQDATRLVTPAPFLAGSKGYLFALADGVSQRDRPNTGLDHPLGAA